MTTNRQNDESLLDRLRLAYAWRVSKLKTLNASSQSQYFFSVVPGYLRSKKPIGCRITYDCFGYVVIRITFICIVVRLANKIAEENTNNHGYYHQKEKDVLPQSLQHPIVDRGIKNNSLYKDYYSSAYTSHCLFVNVHTCPPKGAAVVRTIWIFDMTKHMMGVGIDVCLCIQ